MAEITAEAVKDLRERTGAGFMDCKRALVETEGDVDKAVVLLRERAGGLSRRADEAAEEAERMQRRLAEVAERQREAGESWAGLRTFSADRAPVVGFDARASQFFWLAGQGGCGIETSAALAEIAADLLLDGATQRFDASALEPRRFTEPRPRAPLP